MPGAVLHLRDRLAVDHPARLVGERRVEREEVGRREHLVLRSRACSTPRSRKRSSATNGSYATTVIPRPIARRATCWPIRPKPRTPSVLPSSSTPPQRERSQRPCFSAACACGMLRASATSRPTVCSAAETTVDSGAFATTMPCRVAASTSTLSTPDPRPADHLQARRPLDQLRRQLRRRADHDRVVAADDLLERRVPVLVDLEPRPQQLDARLGDRLADEHPHRHASASYAASAAAPAAPRSTVAPISTSCSSTAPSTVDDVEHVDVADVADPEEPVDDVAVAAGDRDPVPVAQREPELDGVDPGRRQDPGQHRGAVVVGRVELEAHRLRARAAGAADARRAARRRSRGPRRG